MRITFVGCGDAFGSGGRFNTCFHVSTETTRFLIDCGASSLIALKRAKIDVNAIATIFITHFHGDHFGGIPYFLLDAQFFSKRTNPLTLVGPRGLEDWFEKVMETTFPGSSKAHRKFDVHLIEATPGTPQMINDVECQSVLVRHGPPAGPFLAYRLSAGARIVAYTGDTEWTDSLIEVGRNADLMIAEAYYFEKKVPLHMDLATLEAKLPHISPKRLILTHMSEEMLAQLPQISHETAEDGKIVEL